MFARKILVPVDFSKRSTHALVYAIGIARAVGAEVCVLHVLPPPGSARIAFDAYLGRPLPEPSSNEQLQAQDQLRDLVDSVDHSGVLLRQKLAIGDPAATIVCLVSEEAHDLIVIGTHGRTGVADLVVGSVTRTLLSSAPCPVLSLGPAEHTH